MADYAVPSSLPGNAPPPPSPPDIPPPPSGPPPSGPLEAPLREQVAAQPEVTQVSVSGKRLLYTEAPARKGTVEWTLTLTANPDKEQPASASMDRLATAVRKKLDEYLQESQ